MKAAVPTCVFFFCIVQCTSLFIGEVPTGVTPPVRHAAEFAQDRMNFLTNCLGLDVVTDISNATVEAVIGVIYRMDLTLKDSTCTKMDNHVHVTAKTCPPKPGAAAKHCHVTVQEDTRSSSKYTLKDYHC